MKNYEVFTGELEKELKASLDDCYQCSFGESTRLNGVVVHTLTVSKKGSNVSPCIHLDYFFEEYGCGRKIEDIAGSITEIIGMQPSFAKNIPDICWEKVKDHIIFSLINYDANPELISRLPHCRLKDLALIFRIDASFMNFDGFININESLSKVLGKDLETLLITAKQNMNRLLPLRILKMSEILGIETENDESEMLVCTNTEKNYGASAVLYDELKNQLDLDRDYYVIPSSIHETLLLNCDDYKESTEELSDIVRQVNQSDAVSESEFLSDNVYRLSALREEFSSLFPCM